MRKIVYFKSRREKSVILKIYKKKKHQTRMSTDNMLFYFNQKFRIQFSENKTALKA